jgi:SAM-dependent methyltransferase
MSHQYDHEMTEIEGWERRRGIFGEAADAYEAARPGYPDELVDAVLAFAGLDGAPALEVGAGTGKATTAFAERDVAVTCLEPDARMAAVLSRKIADHPQVSVVVSSLEEYDGLDGRFGLLYAAQSWHWVDPAKSWDLADRALRPGGALALFWNNHLIPQGDLHAALSAVHERHDLEKLKSSSLREVPLADSDLDPARLPPAREILADDRFTDVTFPIIEFGVEFDTRRYLDYLDSLSAYRVLAADKREALFADLRQAVDAHGGVFRTESFTVSVFARKRG